MLHRLFIIAGGEVVTTEGLIVIQTSLTRSVKEQIQSDFFKPHLDGLHDQFELVRRRCADVVEVPDLHQRCSDRQDFCNKHQY